MLREHADAREQLLVGPMRFSYARNRDYRALLLGDHVSGVRTAEGRLNPFGEALFDSVELRRPGGVAGVGGEHHLRYLCGLGRASQAETVTSGYGHRHIEAGEIPAVTPPNEPGHSH